MSEVAHAVEQQLDDWLVEVRIPMLPLLTLEARALGVALLALILVLQLE